MAADLTLVPMSTQMLRDLFFNTPSPMSEWVLAQCSGKAPETRYYGATQMSYVKFPSETIAVAFKLRWL